jgi:hypothetical protein
VPLGELLVRMGVVSRSDLQVALSRKMGYPLVDLDAFPVEPDALRRIPFAVAQRLRLMPLLIRDGRLVVALDDPARRRTAVEEAEFSAQMKVVPVLAQCRDIDDALQAAYEKIGAATGARNGPETDLQAIDFQLTDTDKLIETLEREGSQPGGGDDVPIEQSDNSLVRLINNMIAEAHSQGVSDIHIESYPGQREGAHPLPQGRAAAHLPRAAAELPQRDGGAHQDHVRPRHQRAPQAAGRQDQLRQVRRPSTASNCAWRPSPPQGLEDVVMRILASAKPIPLDKLGLSERNLAELQRGRAPLRHGAVRGPHRLGQDDHAALGAGRTSTPRTQDLDRRGPGGNHPARAAPGAGEPEDRLDLRQGAALRSCAPTPT